MPQDSDIVTRIADLCRTKRIRLSEFFQDFDHLRHGECHTCHVRTALSMLSLELSESDYNLLCRIYASPVQNQFCYREFLGDIEQIDRKGLYPVEGHQSINTAIKRHAHRSPRYAQEPNTDIPSLLRRIQSAIETRHVSLRNYLHDFDHLRKGYVTRSALCCVFTVLRIVISSTDMELIASHYGSLDMWRIDYTKLCRDLESVESPPDSSSNQEDIVHSPRSSSALHLLLARLQRRTRIRGIRLLSHFRNYDKHNRWFISGDQFHRVMTTLGYVIDKKELALLCSKYCNDPLNEHFSYPDFVKEMERATS